jgi:hypothetical protein
MASHGNEFGWFLGKRERLYSKLITKFNIDSFNTLNTEKREEIRSNSAAEYHKTHRER